MPQLMPLNWVFSSFMMMLILIVVNIIYSEIMSFYNVQKEVKGESNNLIMWFW